MKTPLIILASGFVVSLAASVALRFSDDAASQPLKYPETNPKRFLAKADAGEVSGVRVIRYAHNPDLVALSGQWSPGEGRVLSILARGRLSGAEQSLLSERNYRESILGQQETVEGFLRANENQPNGSSIRALLLPAADSVTTFTGLGFAVLLGITLMRGSSVGSFQAKLKPTKSVVNLADVAGCDEAKQ
ncbi:MAG: hypothetical protein ABIZ81_15010, partial [Opitutaceae bacterium]